VNAADIRKSDNFAGNHRMSNDVLFYTRDNLISDPEKAARLLRTDSVTKIVIVSDNVELRALIPEQQRFLPEVVIGENVTACHAFLGLKNLYEISAISNQSRSENLDLHYLFRGCERLVRIPRFYTGNVTSMRGMFANCRSLETIPELNTDRVTDFRIMFEHCSSLVYIPALRAAPDAELYGMFSGCHRLERSRLAEDNPREFLDYLRSSQYDPHSIKDRQKLDVIDRVFSRLYSNYEQNLQNRSPEPPSDSVSTGDAGCSGETAMKIKDLAESVNILRRKMDLHLQEEVEAIDKKVNEIENRFIGLENKIDRLTAMMEKLLSEKQ